MQKMLRLWLMGFMSVAGVLAVEAEAATLTHIPSGAPLCLSAAAPAACNGGGASTHDYVFTFDLSSVVDTDHIVTEAVLSLRLFDDFGPADGSEKLALVLDGAQIPINGDVQHDLVLPLTALDSLDDGLLVVSLGAHTGDFFFGGAALTLSLEERPDAVIALVPLTPTTSSVPLPGSLVLLGLGVGALAGAARGPWSRRI